MAAVEAVVAAAGAELHRHGRRDGAIGFGAALCFLGFVGKFNDSVQAYKTRRQIAKGEPRASGFLQLLSGILGRACSRREGFTVAKLCTMLLLRTVGSVWVANHWGKIVNSIVMRNFPRMRMLIARFAGVSISLAVLNALLKYYISLLKQQVREKITLWCHRQYLRPHDMIFYKANKVGDNKIENCDHQITSDVERLSETFTDVLSQSLKPIVDLIVYSVELSRTQGLATPLTLYGWFAFASCVSTVTLPPFGEMAATEQRLEGKFRGLHSDLIANCEQIAFLGGERPEREVLDRAYRQLLAHCKRSIDLVFTSEVVRQYLNKYFVTVIGLFLIARPLRLGMMPRKTPDQIAQYFTSSWRNMEAMASSIQDLFELSNRVGRLSGLASRVHRLLCGLERRPPVLEELIAAAKQGPHPPKFKKGKDLRFEHVSVYKPDGTLLVRDLNFEVTRGQRVLVTGPNGCGKSSLFRVIRKLWPLVEGTITMPEEKDIHFLTQVNFVPDGTLRDLVTYPDSREQMVAAGRSDEDVRLALRWAHVSPEVLPGQVRADLQFEESGKVARPGLDDRRDWQKDLSPGQKQRLAFARLFYHRPSIVVLDECTNGISPDVEHDLYDRCTKLNLAVFSISHKIELKLFHDYELHYEGDLEGSWTFTRCSERQGRITRSSSVVPMLDLSLADLAAANGTAGEGGENGDRSRPLKISNHGQPTESRITYVRESVD
eukprot:TRINITY_DN19146_c0_g1_i1.p1 TRINITY_DN19146_c0_g1~~TRINITY_DN19146_c0_g1_i1.p1  ORF type:complete len:718 (-),score=160.44 TRINITY_DN19146_c0_g1_i1:7-2160(-)